MQVVTGKRKNVLSVGWSQKVEGGTEGKCGKCSLRPPSSTSVQVNPNRDIIYLRWPDSLRLLCFTQMLFCPLCVHMWSPCEPAGVTWVNLWLGSGQPSSKLLSQQMFRISLLECWAALSQSLCLTAFVQHDRINGESFDRTSVCSDQVKTLLWSCKALLKFDLPARDLANVAEEQ